MNANLAASIAERASFLCPQTSRSLSDAATPASDFRTKSYGWDRFPGSGLAVRQMSPLDGYGDPAVKRPRRRLKAKGGIKDEDVAIPVETAPGEVAQVDFGYVGKLYDPDRGVARKAWVFVMTRGYSPAHVGGDRFHCGQFQGAASDWSASTPPPTETPTLAMSYRMSKYPNGTVLPALLPVLEVHEQDPRPSRGRGLHH